MAMAGKCDDDSSFEDHNGPASLPRRLDLRSRLHPPLCRPLRPLQLRPLQVPLLLFLYRKGRGRRWLGRCWVGRMGK